MTRDRLSAAEANGYCEAVLHSIALTVDIFGLLAKRLAAVAGCGRTLRNRPSVNICCMMPTKPLTIGVAEDVPLNEA